MRPLSVVVLAGEAGSPALSTLGGKRALELILMAAGSCRRLVPLAQSVHVVLPAAAAAQATTQLQGFGLGPANVISNGVISPGDWQGEMEDLKLALTSTGVKHHVLVVSANRLTFTPGYNFQRLVEHGLTRDADAVGMQELGPVELELLGHCGHTIAHSYDPPHLVPPLASLEYMDTAEEGMWAIQPLLFLTPTTLAGGVFASSRAPDLVALAGELHNAHGNGKCQLHALSLGPGALSVSNPSAVAYADKCVARLLPLMPVRPDQQLESEEPSTGATGQPALGTAHSLPAMEQLLNTFNNDFFGLSKLSATERVPPTFFMTTYRRLAADMLR